VRLSVLIPCYNENDTIRQVVEAVKAAPYPDKEIIIIDDCSEDGTREQLKTEIAPLVDNILYHVANQGKGRRCERGSRPQLATSSSSRTPIWNTFPVNILS
jgi:glycosyltransferase involved in cell wall biosynthesis